MYNITFFCSTESKQAYIPIEKIIRTSKQSASTSWQCNTSGNHHQPTTYGDLCLKWIILRPPAPHLKSNVAFRTKPFKKTYYYSCCRYDPSGQLTDTRSLTCFGAPAAMARRNLSTVARPHRGCISHNQWEHFYRWFGHEICICSLSILWFWHATTKNNGSV